MVGKRPPLTLRFVLHAFQPVSCRVSVFCSWRRYPPNLLCRRQTLKRPIKRALSAAEWREARGGTLVDPLCQSSEFQKYHFTCHGKKFSANPLFSRVSFNCPFKRWGYSSEFCANGHALKPISFENCKAKRKAELRSYAA